MTPLESTTVPKELFTHSGVPTTEPDTPTPTEPQLRAAAWKALWAQPLLPELADIDLKHISALIALLMDGEWGAVVIGLIANPMSRKKATEIWRAWEPYLAHPPSSPMRSLKVQKAAIKVLIAHHKHGPTAIAAVKDIMDYAEASLTLSAFAKNTNITLEEDPVQIPPL